MSSKRLKVLMDLSLTTEGFSGIPHITRVLFRMFRKMPELDVTGLIYCPRATSVMLKFSDSELPGDKLASQALFLQGIAARNLPIPAPYRYLRWPMRLLKTALLNCDQQELESKVYWDVLWRNYLSVGIPVEDIDVVKDGKFLLSTFSNVAHDFRLRWGLPAQNIDTTGYDICLFMDTRTARLAQGTKKISYYHDLIPVVRPDCLANRSMISIHHRALKRAQHDTTFICNTDHTRADLNSAYPLTTQKSTVIPYPLSAECYPSDLRADALPGIFKSRHNNCCGTHRRKFLAETPKEYIFSCATLEPRKNYPSLFRAFAKVSREHPDLKLVIVANPGWQWEPMAPLMKPLIEQGKLYHLWKVSADEMRVLYSNAKALVFPSYYEGFGMAPIEAMQCNTPVIASDIGAHRDVIGDAGLYINPYDLGSIVDAINRLLYSSESQTLRETLIARGRRRLNLFDPELIGAKYLDLFHRVHEGRAIQDDAPVETPRELQAA